VLRAELLRPQGLLLPRRRRRVRRLPLLLLRRRLLLMADRTVLFVCVENAARSLMAEAYFNADPPDGWRAASGGSSPASTANPRTGPMLREVGLEPPGHPPHGVSPDELERADVRIGMGCRDDASCPIRLTDRLSTDWGIPDPAPMDDAGFRRVRDEIGRKVADLKRELAR
jgi:arsenate reductase (thioredoxin)